MLADSHPGVQLPRIGSSSLASFRAALASRSTSRINPTPFLLRLSRPRSHLPVFPFPLSLTLARTLSGSLLRLLPTAAPPLPLSSRHNRSVVVYPLTHGSPLESLAFPSHWPMEVPLCVFVFPWDCRVQ